MNSARPAPNALPTLIFLGELAPGEPATLNVYLPSDDAPIRLQMGGATLAALSHAENGQRLYRLNLEGGARLQAYTQVFGLAQSRAQGDGSARQYVVSGRVLKYAPPAFPTETLALKFTDGREQVRILCNETTLLDSDSARLISDSLARALGSGRLIVVREQAGRFSLQIPGSGSAGILLLRGKTTLPLAARSRRILLKDDVIVLGSMRLHVESVSGTDSLLNIRQSTLNVRQIQYIGQHLQLRIDSGIDSRTTFEVRSGIQWLHATTIAQERGGVLLEVTPEASRLTPGSRFDLGAVVLSAARNFKRDVVLLNITSEIPARIGSAPSQTRSEPMPQVQSAQLIPQPLPIAESPTIMMPATGGSVYASPTAPIVPSVPPKSTVPASASSPPPAAVPPVLDSDTAPITKPSDPVTQPDVPTPPLGELTPSTPSTPASPPAPRNSVRLPDPDREAAAEPSAPVPIIQPNPIYFGDHFASIYQIQPIRIRVSLPEASAGQSGSRPYRYQIRTPDWLALTNRTKAGFTLQPGQTETRTLRFVDGAPLQPGKNVFPGVVELLDESGAVMIRVDVSVDMAED